MKANLQLCLAVSVCFALVATAAAQDFAIVNKEARFVQTGANVITADPERPFKFLAQVEGSATNPAPPNSVTLPNNAGTRALVFSSEDGGSWSLEQVFATQAALTAAFPNGTYQLTFGGRTISIPLTGDLYPGAPIVTFSGGTFVNGVFVVDRALPLTITATFPQGFVAGSSHIGVSIDTRSAPPGSSGLHLDASNFDSGLVANSVTLTVPANTFVPGAVYEVDAEANRATLLDTTTVPGYTVVGVYSGRVRITVNVSGPPPAPTFSLHPQSQTVAAGSTVVLNAFANGATGYQWRRGNQNISGATGPTLVLSGANTIGGDYTVVATNAAGSATSNTAQVTVSSAVNFGRLINLSILTAIGSAGDSFTLGYVVGGSGTAGAKPLVIRAAAPSLAALGVPGTLNDPRIELFAGGASTGGNDNWGGSAALASAFASVGAFPYAGANSLDAAALAEITTRDNSVKVSATGSGTGQVIAEIYDATPQANITATTPRLLNVSVLKSIDAGGSMTAGFVLRGQTARTVLIRAIGPGLNAAFGVPNTMPDPYLTLFAAGGLRISENDNWGGDASLAAASQAVGAFAIANASSRDAMLLRTLQPGDYTAQVRGVGTAAGNVIVEVYEVP